MSVSLFTLITIIHDGLPFIFGTSMRYSLYKRVKCFVPNLFPAQGTLGIGNKEPRLWMIPTQRRASFTDYKIIIASQPSIGVRNWRIPAATHSSI